MAVGLGAGEFFEEVRVLDGGGDLVVAGGPLAEVDTAATVAAEGEVFVGGEDDGAAGGAAERFDFRSGVFRHTMLILILVPGRGQAWDATGKRLTECGVSYGSGADILQNDVGGVGCRPRA